MNINEMRTYLADCEVYRPSELYQVIFKKNGKFGMAIVRKENSYIAIEPQYKFLEYLSHGWFRCVYEVQRSMTFEESTANFSSNIKIIRCQNWQPPVKTEIKQNLINSRNYPISNRNYDLVTVNTATDKFCLIDGNGNKDYFDWHGNKLQMTLD